MSDDPLDLVRPEPPRSWRDHASAFAESLDLSPRRLAVGLAAVVVVGLVAWRLLAPAEPAPEMELPFADSAASGEGAPGAAGAHVDAASPPASGQQPASADAGASVPAGSGSTVPSEVVVHVAGAVGRPGVQRLPAGSRVVDVVEAAGGANPDADLARINLAVPLQDGQQVYVPRVGEVPPAPLGSSSPSTGPAGSASPSGSSGPVSGQPVNINTASADELDTLPGVGPATAEAIISYREQNGPFTSVDQLLDVRGIGDAKLEQLRNLVAV